MNSQPFAWSDEQERIVQAPPGACVVVAGAGTGKTETLTGRVLQLLLDGAPTQNGASEANGQGEPCELHQIVALTFTDKAAAEMRGRIYKGLVERLRAETDPVRRARLERLRDEWGTSNRIGTFDAWTRKILDTFPEAALGVAGVPPGFETTAGADERELHTLLSRAFWERCEGLEGEAREDLFDLLSRYDRALLLRLVADLSREETSTLERLSLATPAAEVREDIGILCEEARERHDRRATRQADTLWQRAQAALPEELPQPLRLALEDRALVSDRVLTYTSTWRRDFARNWPPEALERAGVALPAFKRWRDALTEARKERELLDLSDEAVALEAESRGVVRKLAALARDWKASRVTLTAQERKLAFDEISGAASLILRDPQLAQRVRAGCKWVLIDEFQDTNDAQWGLIEALKVPNVLIVGDEKQSIYAFRQGDITVFDRVRRELLEGGEPLELTTSRRSTPAIVAWCNRVFHELLPAPDEREEYEAPFLALQPAPGDTRTGQVHVLSPLSAQESDEEDERARGAQAIAKFLRALQDDADEGESASARLPQFAGIAEKLRAGEAGTIGVLFRTHERKAACEAALDDAGVRYASVKGIGFWQSEAARDALNLAAWLAEPRDDLALVGILRSPFGGLSDLALLHLRARNLNTPLWDVLNEGAPLTFPAEEREVLSLLTERLARWLRLARVRPLSEVLETARRESEAAFYEAGWADAAQRAANWGKLADEIRAREDAGRGSPREIAAYLRGQESLETREPDAPLPDSGAIQLMTVYAAKGLGFPMTLVAQTDDTPRQPPLTLRRGLFPERETVQVAARVEGQGGERLLPPLWHVLASEEKARSDAEWLRLLYVACTRARDELVVLLPQARREGTWAALLAPFCEGLPSCAQRSEG